jgi:hypothetical protein
MRAVAVALLLGALGLTSALSAELRPRRSAEGLGVLLLGLEFPDSLRSELTTGLASRLLMRIDLESDDVLIERCAVMVEIRYDLWDEVFHTALTVDGRLAQASKFERLEAVLEHLDRLHAPALFALQGLNERTQYVLKAEVLLNPIDRERMEKIRQWVARDGAFGGGPREFGAARPQSAQAAAMFQRLFEQYASGAQAAAVWRTALASERFTLSEGDSP